MNAVEIEEAVSGLAEQPFDPDEFPFAFLEAFGNKATTLKRLRTGSTNTSDLPGGVLQRNNIHIAVAVPNRVTQTLSELRINPATEDGKSTDSGTSNPYRFGRTQSFVRPCRLTLGYPLFRLCW